MGIEQAYWAFTPDEFQPMQQSPKVAAEILFRLDLMDSAFKHLERLKNEGQPITPQTYLEVFVRPQEERLSPLKDSGRYMEIGKSWHAIHFLLTGESDLAEKPNDSRPPTGKIILGGTPLKAGSGLDDVRYFTPEEVRTIADALNEITEDDLRLRFDVSTFNKAEIYPGRGGWSQEDIEWVLEKYAGLDEFVQQAADDGNYVVTISV